MAGATVVVGAATGVVTNLITSQWAIGLAVGLGALLVVGVILQVALVGVDTPDSKGYRDGPARSVVRQHVRARGRPTIIQAGGDVTISTGDGPAPSGSGKEHSQ